MENNNVEENEDVSFGSMKKRKRNTNMRKKPNEVEETRKSPPREEEIVKEEENKIDDLTEKKNKLTKKMKNIANFTVQKTKTENNNTEENEKNISEKIRKEVESQIFQDEEKEKEQILKEKTKGETSSDNKETGDGDQIYKGKNNYKKYVEVKEEPSIKGAGIKAGPVRASNYVKRSSRFDYQPDICKDFKETGFCGYGYDCKFLHDRGDYKSGWELEKEWEKEQKEKSKKKDVVMQEVEDQDNLPFACYICRNHFTLKSSPVVTKCEHYFCEKCALDHYRKNKSCFICKEATQGIFNKATKLIDKIKLKMQTTTN